MADGSAQAFRFEQGGTTGLVGWGRRNGITRGFIPEPLPTCYANCDGSTVQPVLNVDDFTCFINALAAGCR